MKKSPTPLTLDPHRQREAAKYAEPIYSREYILDFLHTQKKLFSFEFLASTLKVSKPTELKSLHNRIKAMLRDAQLQKYGHFIGIPHYQPTLLDGRIDFNSEGHTILQTSAGAFLVATLYKRMLFRGDEVTAHLMGWNKYGQQEAHIISITKRFSETVIGHYKRNFNVEQVQPLSKDPVYPDMILLPTVETSLQENDLIRAQFVIYPSPTTSGVLKLLERIDLDLMSQNVLKKFCDLIHYKYAFPSVDPTDAAHQDAAKIQNVIPEQERQKRTNLCALPFITIDSADTQDIDDAICVEGHTLYVAIADVTYYVPPKSNLDLHARQKAASIYFPHNTLHMLPEQLSQHVCSLQPHEEKLVLVCEINFNPEYQATGCSFYEAVINSRGKLTYDAVHAFITHSTPLGSVILEQQVLQCHQLYTALERNGAHAFKLDFERVDTKLIFNQETTDVESLAFIQTNVAHKIIETFMILANQHAAKYLYQRRIPAIYRVHPAPTAEKLQQINHYLQSLGISRYKIKPKASSFKQLLNEIKAHSHAQFISLMIIRSLSAAFYTASPQPHFALDLKHYTHFTSPIRRYADLVTHTLIKSTWKRKKSKVWTRLQLDTICQDISHQSRNIDSAENDVKKFLKCRLMQKHIHQVLVGVVSLLQEAKAYIYLVQFDIEVCAALPLSSPPIALKDTVKVKIMAVDPLLLIIKAKIIA